MTIRVGLVGAGLAVFDLHVPALQEVGNVEISRVATSTMPSASAAAGRLAEAGFAGVKPCTVDDVIAATDVDVVLVAVPIASTADVVSRAIAARKAVLAEKPIAVGSDEAAALLAQAKASGTALLAGENFRLQPDFSRIRELVGDGAVGEPRVYFLNDLHFTGADGKYAQTEWRIDGAHPGGYLIDGGTHIVAGMREMVGRKIRGVHGLATEVRPYLSNQSDTLLLNVQFEGGFIGHLALGYGVFDSESRHPKVYGTEATLALMPSGIVRINEDGEELLEPKSGVLGFAEEWRVLLGALESSRMDEVWRLTEESVLDLRLLELGIRSASTGQTVDFE